MSTFTATHTVNELAAGAWSERSGLELQLYAPGANALHATFRDEHGKKYTLPTRWVTEVGDD